MSRTRAYRCLNCLEHTIDRQFDTSHLSVTCPDCGSFERFVNEAVFQQFEAFEASPPAAFDWERLSRTEKFVVAERLVRSTKTLDDFEVVDGEPTQEERETADDERETADDDGADEGSTGEGSTDEGSTNEIVVTGPDGKPT